MAAVRLDFLRNDAGENEGLGDAGIETFKDDPYASCGRETGQNSKDAASGNAPVRMTFDIIEVSAELFPGRAELESAVQACKSEATEEKDTDFFNQATQLLQSSSIKVLRIADYETKGLIGPPDKAKTPFHSLLKGAGVSSKESATSGGSFGIGKNAAFAVSDLRTVFYSTVYRNSENAPVFAAQGKVRLVSHVDADGQPRRATAYWGDPNGFNALTSCEDVPDWMRRSEVGTTIFSAGFRQEEMWAERIAYSLLANFFVAIEQGEMAFAIDNGRLQINASTVGAMFADPAIRAAAEKAGRRDDLEFSASLHRCLCSKNAVEEHLAIAGLGDVKVRVLVEDDLPRKVGIARNGMLITTTLEHFGDKLERFSGKDFVALVQPAPNASKLMKTLENPRHDSFSANRIDDPQKRADADRAMRALHRKLRATIREIIAVEAGDEVLLDEMNEFFGDDPTDQRPPDPKSDHDPERFTYIPPMVRRKRAKSPAPNAGNEGGGGTKRGGNKPDNGGGPGTGGGSGGKGSSGFMPRVALGDVRNQIQGDEEGQSRTIYFTPTKSGETMLTLSAKGVFGDEQLKLASASSGVIFKGDLKLMLEEGVRTRVDVRLAETYRGPIELVAHQAQEDAQ